MSLEIATVARRERQIYLSLLGALQDQALTTFLCTPPPSKKLTYLQPLYNLLVGFYAGLVINYGYKLN